MTDTTVATEDSKTLHGTVVDSHDPVVLNEAIERAFHYRGDVTITFNNGKEPLEGFVFDRRLSGEDEHCELRLIPKGSDSQATIPISSISTISFSGKDTASGKSFESWIRKYAQKKLAGEPANIESEPL